MKIQSELMTSAKVQRALTNCPGGVLRYPVMARVFWDPSNPVSEESDELAESDEIDGVR